MAHAFGAQSLYSNQNARYNPHYAAKPATLDELSGPEREGSRWAIQEETMAGIIDSLNSTLTPDALEQLGMIAGIDPATLDTGLRAAAPTLLGSLAKISSTGDGASYIYEMLPQDTGDGVMGYVMSSIAGGAGNMQPDMLSAALGPAANGIAGTLSQKLGFNMRPILGVAVPLIMGLIGKAAREANLDASGLANMLNTEARTYMEDPANRDTADLVASALEAGDRSAALRNAYGDDEWEKIRLAPVAALYLVAIASPSDHEGQLQELQAAVDAVMDAVKNTSPTSLIGTGFGGGFTRAELEQLYEDAPSKEQVLGIIGYAHTLVSQRSPTDAQAYRAMLLYLAQKAAEAAMEGGFLGNGGVLVSKEEEQAIEEIKAALA